MKLLLNSPLPKIVFFFSEITTVALKKCKDLYMTEDDYELQIAM